MEIANVIAPNSKIKIIGIRPGEKLHEQMIGPEDAPHTYEYEKYFKILPNISNFSKDANRIKKGIKVNDKFIYNSNTNKEWMTEEELKLWLKSYTGNDF